MHLIKQIDHIYKLYGYEIIKATDEVRVYRYRQGIYYAVDIVQISKNVNVDIIKKEYSEIGYATKIIEAVDSNNLSKIETRLFYGFFEIDQTSSRLYNKYLRYSEKLSTRLGADYEYITCPFKLISGENSENFLNSTVSNDLSIIETIDSFIKSDKAHLLLIEAAAGFGKTSTVYEVLRNLTNDVNSPIPIFIELSKNRQAKIFKHVLLNEFEDIYPYLKFELILNEIQSGKIPLIIDGFDELLYNSHAKIENDIGEYEDIQAMLQTIGEIIRNKAKIILTTRRTAVLSGDDFFKWASDNSHEFLTTRLLIERPNISDWIGNVRFKKLSEKGIPISHLSNPVLLSYIKNISDDDFEKCCNDSKILIQNYFEKILIREQDRQNLLIEPSIQLQIFEKLANSFIEYRIDSEEKNFIKDLILSENENLLKDVIQKYPPSERPNLDDLAETLCNHALLDRKGSFEKQIGFINDFVYGYLISSLVCNKERNWIENNFILEKHIELSSISFKLMPSNIRRLLWEKISYISEIIDPQTLLMVDIHLLDKPNHQFKEMEFGSLEISDAVFGDSALFLNCVFSDSVFTDTKFIPEAFIDVSFVGCFFRNCTVISIGETDGSRWVFGGEDYGNGFIEKFKGERTNITVSPVDDEIDYEKRILEQFWPPGREHYTTRLKIRTLYRGFNSSKSSPINNAIKTLTQKDWIVFENDSVILNKTFTKDIMKILGRSL